MESHFETLRLVRRSLINLLEGHSLATLNHIPSGYNNNLVWNLAHVLVSQQLLVYRPAKVPMRIDDALIEKYRRGTRPDSKATNAEIEQLRQLAWSTIDMLEVDYAAGRFTEFEPFQTGIGIKIATVEDAIKFLPIHEAMHYGYSIALKRMLS